jgi:hypothetical protein
MLNYATTKAEYGEGRTTYANPEGNRFSIYIGRNPDGTERYMKLGKQFREPIEWIIKPLLKGTSKFSPLFREGGRQLFSHDAGTGFPAPWTKEDDPTGKLKERLKSIAMTPVPLSMRGLLDSNRNRPFMFSIPTSKGMTKYGGTKQMQRALKSKDRKKLRETYIHALQNNLPADKMAETARQQVRGKFRYDAKQLAKDIFIDMQALKTVEQKKDFLEYMSQKGVLSPLVREELNKLRDEYNAVKNLQKKYEIQSSW